jgi:hypothetical protein
MKFDMHRFWRHENFRDVFFEPTTVSFDDDGRNAILHGKWLTQGSGRWFYTPVLTARIKITPEQYNSWKAYTPRGILKP